MERAGLKLRRTRERLKLTYREVVEASHSIARQFGNPEFGVALSRLADIENKGRVPTIFRLYSLCAIYRLDFDEALSWYGVPLDQLTGLALRTPLPETHAFHIRPRPEKNGESAQDIEIDLGKTTFLSQLLRGWGGTPLRFLDGAESRYRYGLIGLADRSMYPLLHPGSLVIIDDQARIVQGEWTYEVERPIYFFEHREGYVCGWCDLTGERLLVLPHPSSHSRPQVFQYPADIDLVGQVVGVAALWEPARRSRNRKPEK